MLNLLEQRARAPDKEASNMLFVYGTLMSGQDNHHILEEMIKKRHAELISADAFSRGMIVVSVRGLPMLYSQRIAEDNLGCVGVAGELYRVTPVARNLLDAFEGHPHLYRRMAMVVRYRNDGGLWRESLAGGYVGPTPAGAIGRGDSQLGLGLVTTRNDPARVVSSWAERQRGVSRPVYWRAGVVSMKPPDEAVVRFRVRPNLDRMWVNEEVDVLDGDEQEMEIDGDAHV